MYFIQMEKYKQMHTLKPTGRHIKLKSYKPKRQKLNSEQNVPSKVIQLKFNKKTNKMQDITVKI